MTDRDQRVLIAAAGRMSLVLTGEQRGTTWYLDESPGDGLWVVHGVNASATTKWTKWTRPTTEEIAAYQLFVADHLTRPR